MKVMSFGTFDGIHPGHLFFFKEARKLGDFLVVVVARDSTVLEVKARPPLHNEKVRMAGVMATGLVDKVVLGSATDREEAIKMEQPDVICLGYDQHHFVDVIKGIKIVRLPSFHPEKYKSSIINKGL